ncbi:MAG: histidinol dehydrogenase [Spirochaetaceae bacterium]|jgi:histidinol dehydrogenase|nr:histidinol dehydrogenase [Spirochaetaceae bacterium]
MQIVDAGQFDNYWKSRVTTAETRPDDEGTVDSRVREIIEAVRSKGDAAVRRYAQRFDKSSPEKLEVPTGMAEAAWEALRKTERKLAAAMELAAFHIRDFAELQRKQFADFETEMDEGLFTGQRIIPVERAAVYVPAGRFPLFSSVLMGMLPALAAGVEELVLASPPMEDGFPAPRIMAAAALAVSLDRGKMAAGAESPQARLRIFAMGGAQAIAALALGTESVPRASVIIGPGNKYVAAAKRMLFGEVGIDFVAGPTDVLIIVDHGAADVSKAGAAVTGSMSAGTTAGPAEIIAADMLAQAEHDPDARARALVPNSGMAEKISTALERRLAALPEESRAIAGASLDAGGLIVVYKTREEAIRIANIIAPEHLELHSENPGGWTSGTGDRLKNYGSLFTGALAAEVLGDYSAGVNHTLPTSGSARFTGGLSVRHFLKTVTTLRCTTGAGFEKARKAAEILGRAEGLIAHSRAAYERTVYEQRRSNEQRIPE